MFALFLVVATGRAVFSADRRAPHVIPDELASLGMARWLAGGNWTMFDVSTWRPGLALILTPVLWFTDEPVEVVRLSLLVNAGLGGLCAVVLARLGGQISSLRGRSLWVSCCAIALMPASLSASAHVWAEPLVTVSFLLTMLALTNFVTDGNSTAGCAAIAATSLGLLAHSRMLPLLILVGLIVVVAPIVRGQPKIAGSMAIVWLCCGSAVTVSSAWIFDRVWEATGEENTFGETVRRLRNPLQVLDAALGQLWYLLVTTALTFGLGVVALVQTGRNAPRYRARGAQVVLTSTAVLIATSAVFMSDRPRADYIVYGRYNDAIVWPILLVAAGWLVHEAPRMQLRSLLLVVGGVAVVAVELALLVRQLHHRQLSTRATGQMIGGLLPVLGTDGLVKPTFVTLLAVAIGGSLVAVARLAKQRSTIALAAVVGAILGIAGVAAHRFESEYRNSFGAVASIDDLGPDEIRAGESIWIAFVPDVAQPSDSLAEQKVRGLLIQWYLPDHPLVWDTGGSLPQGRLVIAPENDVIMNQTSAIAVWRDPGSSLVLWREPLGVDGTTAPFTQPSPVGAHG